jgi:hypothetical protein
MTAHQTVQFHAMLDAACLMAERAMAPDEIGQAYRRNMQRAQAAAICGMRNRQLQMRAQCFGDQIARRLREGGQ